MSESLDLMAAVLENIETVRGMAVAIADHEDANAAIVSLAERIQGAAAEATGLGLQAIRHQLAGD